jgi:hypothetical protein
MDSKALATEVRQAFSDAPSPSESDYVLHVCPECAEVERAFRGRSWRELPAGTILERKDALPLLAPPALRFYLPAFVLLAIERYEEADTIPDSILSTVRRGAADFSEAELHVLRRFAEYLREEHGEDYPDDLPERAMRRLA